MGRDHTIYATEHGYVKYYKDPERHPKRQYIGVVFERDQVLPLPRNAMRRRRLGMTTSRIEKEEMHTSALMPALGGAEAAVEEPETQVKPATVMRTSPMSVAIGQVKGKGGRVLTLRPGYMYRESNWEIGRAAERAKIKVKEFTPRDRWAAWKNRIERKRKTAEKRSLSRRTKK